MTDITDFSDSEITAYIKHHEDELRKFREERQRREAEIARRRVAENAMLRRVIGISEDVEINSVEDILNTPIEPSLLQTVITAAKTAKE